MNQSHRNTPVVMVVSLIVLGIAAVALAFWLIDQPRELPASGLLFAVFLGVRMQAWRLPSQLIRDRGTSMIRLAQLDDLPAIVNIYNQSIPSRQSTGDLRPVRVEDRVTWLEEHRPEEQPVFVADANGQVAGWCSLSAYRPGRAALRVTREISYCIALPYQRQGIGTALIEHALAACPALQIKHIFAIVLEGNEASLKLLEKMGFEQWGYLPRGADFDGKDVGHFYYGRHV